MQRWEYCEVHFSPCLAIFYRPNEILKFPIKKDRNTNDMDDVDALKRYIAQLGIDGWEAVSDFQNGILLKRPLE